MNDERTETVEITDDSGTTTFKGTTAELGAELKARVESGFKNPKMKPDPTFDAAADNAYRVTAAELRQFIERFERLEVEKNEVADQQKEVMAEAKGRGYNTKAMRQIIRERKRSREDLAEEQAVLDLYREALGMT